MIVNPLAKAGEGKDGRDNKSTFRRHGFDKDILDGGSSRYSCFGPEIDMYSKILFLGQKLIHSDLIFDGWWTFGKWST